MTVWKHRFGYPFSATEHPSVWNVAHGNGRYTRVVLAEHYWEIRQKMARWQGIADLLASPDEQDVSRGLMLYGELVMNQEADEFEGKTDE